MLLMKLHSEPKILRSPGGLWLNRTFSNRWANKTFLLGFIVCTVQGTKSVCLSCWYRVPPTRIFLWPNGCRWLNSSHLHQSPLKRDANELNEWANYARSVWGACWICSLVCENECVCTIIGDRVSGHASALAFVCALVFDKRLESI